MVRFSTCIVEPFPRLDRDLRHETALQCVTGGKARKASLLASLPLILLNRFNSHIHELYIEQTYLKFVRVPGSILHVFSASFAVFVMFAFSEQLLHYKIPLQI